MSITAELKLEMFRRMVRIREFELAAMDVFKRGLIKGTVHPYIGEEASGVGVCLALRPDDVITGTHRSHGHNIAKGAESRRMMAPWASNCKTKTASPCPSPARAAPTPAISTRA
jgi:pyruvate dehydrogenase E1 component alpha subunit